MEEGGPALEPEANSFGQAIHPLNDIMSSLGKWNPGGKDRGIVCHTWFSTVDGGRLHIHFVSTDYDTLILYVRVQDNEVVNLWALLGKW